MKIIDRLLDRFANSLYSRAFNNGINLDKEVEWIDRDKVERLLRDRLEKAVEERNRAHQEYYSAMTEVRRLSLLVSPEAKTEFDKVVRDRSSLLFQNEKLKIENQLISIENDDLREQLLNLQPEENEDETERTDV